MKKSHALGYALFTLGFEFIANWIVWIHARKTRINKMTAEQIDEEISKRKHDIDSFIEQLPSKVDEIETADAEETEIEKWRAAYEREQAAKSQEK